MDSFKQAMAAEWLDQLEWIRQQIDESDDGDLTLVLDLLTEAKNELENLL